MVDNTEIITLSRFFDLAGNKRNFITEDIIDHQEGSLDIFIQKIRTILQNLWKPVKRGGFVSIVNNISERNELGNEAGILVWVENASDDDTVNKGGAAYLSIDRDGEVSWNKLAESESMDISLSWEDIIGKPNSSPSEIDDSVNKAHTHTNSNTINEISDKKGFLSFGKFLLNGYTGIDTREELSQRGDFTSRIKISVEDIKVE